MSTVPDRDPPRLSDSGPPGDPLRAALSAARADSPSPEALSRLAARLPLSPGPGGGGPDGGSGAGTGEGPDSPPRLDPSPALPLAAKALSPMAASVGSGAALGVIASALLWLFVPTLGLPPSANSAPPAILGASRSDSTPPAPGGAPALAVTAPGNALSTTALATPRSDPPPPSLTPAPTPSASGPSPGDSAPPDSAPPDSAPPTDSASPPDESEAALLARAQSLAGSSPTSALALCEQHRARFPKGSLGQERELIAVSALVAAGRTSEARARAEAMLAAHPDSAHRRRLSVLIPDLGAGAP